LRTTAPPSAFLMLKPKRLCGSWFTRKKTVKWELERRFPVRYTASNSPRRTNRAARGNSRRPGLLGREPMASLLAACREHPAAALGLHAHAKPVRFSAPAFARLISSLRQSNPPLCYPRRVTCYFYAWRERAISGVDAHTAVRPSGGASTGRLSSRFRISKCSRLARTRSRK